MSLFLNAKNMAGRNDSWRGGGTGRGAYIFTANSASQTPVTIRLAAGATADGFLIEASDGTDLFKVDPSGNITFSGSTTISVNQSITGNLSVTGTLSITGTSSFTADATFNQDATILGNLSVSGTTTTGNINVNGNVVLNDFTAGSLLVVGSGGTVIEDNANLFWDDTNNALLIGTATFTSGNGQLQIVGAAGSAETLQTWTVADDATAMLQITNGTGTAGIFIPKILGLAASTNIALLIQGTATTDSGTAGVITFDSRTAAGGAIATRPLVAWRNFGTEYMQLNVNGALRLGKAEAYSQPSGATGVLHYNSSSGILTLASVSSSGNTQFNLNTAIGSGTNATRFSIGSTGRMNFSPAAISSGVTTGITWTTPADTGLTAATESNVFSTTSATRTWADGTVATQRDYVFLGNTWAKTTTSAAFTNATTLFASSPIAGTGVTISSSYAAWFQANSLASNNEKIARFDVSDDTGSSLTIENASGSDSVMYPLILGVQGGNTGGLLLVGQTTTDSSTTTACIELRGRIGTSTVPTTKPVMYIRAAATVITTLNPKGKWLIEPIASTSGVVADWVLTPAANTGITASTASNVFRIDTATRAWATTGTVADQADVLINGMTYNSASASQTFTKVSTLYVAAAPASAGANAIFTNTAAIRAGGDVTIGATSASMQYAAFDAFAHTVTVTGSTQVTSAASFAMAHLHTLTITDASAVTIDNASTLYIAAAPVAAGSVTITKAYSLWIDAGLPRIDSTSANGSVATVLGSVGPAGSNTTVQEWLTIDIGGTTRYIPCF